AGVGLGMEGSTLQSGRYADNLRRATAWLLAQAERDGLAGGGGKRPRSRLAHAQAVTFLAHVYADEEALGMRVQLRRALEHALKVILDSQSPRGGWATTVSPKDAGREDAVATATVSLALRTLRNADLPVPREALRRARAFLEGLTDADGGVESDDRSASTVAAAACLFGPTDPTLWDVADLRDPLCGPWLRYCGRAVPLKPGMPGGVPE